MRRRGAPLWIVRGITKTGTIYTWMYRSSNPDERRLAIKRLRSLAIGEIIAHHRRIASWGVNDIYDGMPAEREIVWVGEPQKERTEACSAFLRHSSDNRMRDSSPACRTP